MLAISHRGFTPNVPAFFTRIGIEYNPETTKPSLELLRLLHRKFVKTFPFENLNIHFEDYEFTDKNKCKVDIHPEIIEKKIIFNQRGGYCFELNQYFHYILRALGFNVTPLMGRTIWKQPPETAQQYRNHFTNVVTFPPTTDEPFLHQYLCDVSFGPACFVEPLSLHDSWIDKAQSTKYDSHRIIRYQFTQGEEEYMLDNSKDHYLLQVLKDSGEWDSLYIFHKKELSIYPDWVCGNWHVATSPDSLFVNNILISIVTEEGKYTLFNNHLIIRNLKSNDEEENQVLTSASGEMRLKSEVIRKDVDREEYFQILSDVFHYNIDEKFKEKLRIPGLDYPEPAEEH